MDAEIAPILQITQRLIWNTPQSDLQRRTIVNDRGDIAGDALRNIADLRMNILCNRCIDLHQRIEAVEMHEALAVGARHCWIDLRDCRARDTQDCWREVHGYAEADKAPSVWRRNLEQRHVDRQPSARQQTGYLLQRDGHVVELATGSQTTHVA